MTATTKRPDAFGSMLTAFATLYKGEIERLADENRGRILAGELSGYDDRMSEPRYFRFERELEERHPWLRTIRGSMAVIGISSWTRDPRNNVELSEDRIIRNSAAECMVNDVMLLAVARGWVKPPARGQRQYDACEPYAQAEVLS